MTVRIISAAERLSAAENKTSLAIFGPVGVGKTSLLMTLPENSTVCFDLEAGLKSVQSWQGESIPIRDFGDFLNLVALVGGPDPAAEPSAWFSNEHVEHVRRNYAGKQIEELLQAKPIIFVDSITDLTRQALRFSQKQPEAFSEKTGKPDIRGAYGYLARVVIASLKHLQHAAGKTVIFVGVLEKKVDEFDRLTWQPQMEGSKSGRELPGIVDQVVSMQTFSTGPDGDAVLDECSEIRSFVCRAGNPFGLPAKDRSGRLDMLEPPDLGALLQKINQP
jgi:hypothetical protein